MQQQESKLTCPKCHQPIEGDEPYICCANVRLQWRCRNCSKVSEGFAFPYGMCPHCGGKLDIVSIVGKGTQVTVRMTLGNMERHAGGPEEGAQ